MENKLSTTTEGEELKSVFQVIGDVLAENTMKNQFLHNVGFLECKPGEKRVSPVVKKTFPCVETRIRQ